MFLEEKHQLIAKEIVQKNRKKKSCNKCYDRGFVGFTNDKTIIPCEKCVDIDAAMEEWKNYVANDEELKEQFNDLFEEENVAEGSDTEETSSETTSEKDELHTSIKKTKKDSVEKLKVNHKTNTAQTKSSTPKTVANTTKSSPVRKTSGRGK